MGGTGSQPHGVNVLKKASVWLLRNVGAPGRPVLAPPEVVPLEAGQPATYGGHSCVPAPCFLGGASGDRDQASSDERRLPDMLVGSENGRVYAYRRAYVLARARVLGSELVQ
jgi:hypothetical protein